MSDRVKAHRERMKQAGWQQSAIWLPPKAVARLKKLCKAQGLTKQEAITRLILQTDARAPETPAPASKKAPARKKPAAKLATAAPKKKLAKKKAAAKKKATSRRRKTAVELDTIGLERPVGYEDWEAAVSIRIDRGVNNRNGKHTDWDWGMLRDSYQWDGEAELAGFKKKHKKAIAIEASYPYKHKRTIEYRARYPDGKKDHRIVLGALPAKKKR